MPRSPESRSLRAAPPRAGRVATSPDCMCLRLSRTGADTKSTLVEHSNVCRFLYCNSLHLLLRELSTPANPLLSLHQTRIRPRVSQRERDVLERVPHQPGGDDDPQEVEAGYTQRRRMFSKVNPVQEGRGRMAVQEEVEPGVHRMRRVEGGRAGQPLWKTGRGQRACIVCGFRWRFRTSGTKVIHPP